MKHPYPEHVVEAVAKALYPHVYKWPYDTANKALQALWDASRIDWVDEVDNLPDDALIRHSDGMAELGEYFKLERTFADHPAHVIYWGDADE